MVSELFMGIIILLFIMFPVLSVFFSVGLFFNIYQLFLEFAAVFDKLSGLLFFSVLDYDILFISGVFSVSVSLYRYFPAIKDEIERQVQEMFITGII